jgi:short-subunit dehydrogenase
MEAARRGHDMLLAASDARDLAALASHVRLMYSITCDYVSVRLGAEAGTLDCILKAVNSFGVLDGALYPVGWADDEDTVDGDVSTIEALLDINLASQMKLTSALWPLLAARPAAFIIGFGSVAAIRGRRRNVVYAAAKRGLLSYFESLRHAAAGTRIHVQFYQLGYLDTQQTLGKRLPFPKASPEALAKYVLDNLTRDCGSIFYPKFWHVISIALRMLPWFVYKRLKF